MPLSQGKSRKAFSHNVEAEMNAGKPRDQALAIAYSVKRRNKKAQGGQVNADELADVNSRESFNGGGYDEHDAEEERQRRMSGAPHLARGGQVNQENNPKIHVDDDWMSDEESDRPLIEGRENAEGALEDIDDISDTSISDIDQEPGGKTNRKLLESIMRNFRMRKVMGGPKAGLD